MTVVAFESARPYDSDPAQGRTWGLISTMIALEARRHQKERPSPRLVVGVMLWVEEQLLPKDPDPKSRLKQMLRKQLTKHQILLCSEDVHIGLFKEGDLKGKPLEIIPHWAVAVPEREFEELAKAARDLAQRSLHFAERMENVTTERS